MARLISSVNAMAADKSTTLGAQTALDFFNQLISPGIFQIQQQNTYIWINSVSLVSGQLIPRISKLHGVIYPRECITIYNHFLNQRGHLDS